MTKEFDYREIQSIEDAFKRAVGFNSKYYGNKIRNDCNFYG